MDCGDGWPEQAGALQAGSDVRSCCISVCAVCGGDVRGHCMGKGAARFVFRPVDIVTEL